LQGNFGTSTTPYIGNKTNPIQYWPHGVPYKVPLGNGLWHTLWLVNGHLQPTAYWDAVNDNGNDFLRIEYPNWVNGSGQNNGNLQGTTIWAGGPSPSANLPQFSESFTYDGENRLTSASDSGGWSRGFSYDQWGNMAVTANNGVPAMNVNTPQSLSLFNANNQRTDQTYFPNGNLKSIQPGITLAYDAENRQTSAGGYSYSYDGAGHRVAKIGGGATTIYVYDAAGQLAEEYAPGSAWKKDYVRLGSQLIAEEYNGTVSASMPCTTCYFTYDHLGTVRLITDQNANVISRHDYLPFGEEIPANTAGRNSTWGPGNDSVTQKFTGKERDSESGLDYFGARYYGSALGRFTSPDWSVKPVPVPYADLANPQSLNQYSYVLNNPLGRADADGHCPAEDQCSKITVTAQVAKEPTVKTDPPKGGKQTATVEGEVHYTIKDGAKPLAGTQVHEVITNQVSRDGEQQRAQTTTRDDKTNEQGVIGDQVSHSYTAIPGLAEGMLTDSVNTKETTQVLTITSPSGAVCQCTEKRTLTNADANGQASDEYRIDLKTPKVQMSPAQTPPKPQ
jgi:RHS repeat-associated protein